MTLKYKVLEGRNCSREVIEKFQELWAILMNTSATMIVHFYLRELSNFNVRRAINENCNSMCSVNQTVMALFSSLDENSHLFLGQKKNLEKEITDMNEAKKFLDNMYEFKGSDFKIPEGFQTQLDLLNKYSDLVKKTQGTPILILFDDNFQGEYLFRLDQVLFQTENLWELNKKEAKKSTKSPTFEVLLNSVLFGNPLKIVDLQIIMKKLCFVHKTAFPEKDFKTQLSNLTKTNEVLLFYFIFYIFFVLFF